MVHILRQYGYSFIFLAVFAENVGLPVPSYPVMLVAAALAATLHLRIPLIFIACMLAALGPCLRILASTARSTTSNGTGSSLCLLPNSCPD